MTTPAPGDPVTRAAERDLADMQAAYLAHRTDRHTIACINGDLVNFTVTCSTCAAFKDHVARCQRQLQLLSGDAEPSAEPLF
jgi:hypothetical protein